MVREIEYPMDELCKHPPRLAHLNSSIMNHVITAAHLMRKSVYSDGHSYCFSLSHLYPWWLPISSHSSFSSPVNYPWRTGSFEQTQPIEDTCKKYRIYKHGDTLRFNYYTADGRLIGAKVKTKDKQFKYEGDTEGTFFGQHLFPNSGKRVVITEGELDAASCYQAMPGWQMVSLPSGAASAKKSIQKIWNGYKVTMKYVSSLIMTMLDTKQHRKQPACFHLKSHHC